jgi:hypothetical protein
MIRSEKPPETGAFLYVRFEGTARRGGGSRVTRAASIDPQSDGASTATANTAHAHRPL